jgi:outer membrane receptor protein involved in Fe transport
VPKLRGTVGLGLERAAWSASIDGRYVGRYRDYNPLNNGVYLHLGNTWTWDLNMRWDLGEDLRLRGSWLSKLHVALGAVNVFDRPPQFSASTAPGFGFDAGQYDIRGRYAYAQVGLQF